MRPPSGGPHRSPPAETGDIPRHSLITPWRLHGYTCMGSTDLHAPSLHMMGRGIPAPTPPDTKWDMGALLPIPSVHRRVTVRSRNGRLAHVHQWAVHDLPRRIKCDRDGWSAPINAFGRRRSRPLKPPRGVQAKASGFSLGSEGYNEVPRTPRGMGGHFLAERQPSRGGLWARRVRSAGKASFSLAQVPPVPYHRHK